MSLIQIINLEPVSDEEMEERFDLTREQLAEREEIYVLTTYVALLTKTLNQLACSPIP